MWMLGGESRVMNYPIYMLWFKESFVRVLSLEGGTDSGPARLSAAKILSRGASADTGFLQILLPCELLCVTGIPWRVSGISLCFCLSTLPWEWLPGASCPGQGELGLPRRCAVRLARAAGSIVALRSVTAKFFPRRSTNNSAVPGCLNTPLPKICVSRQPGFWGNFRSPRWDVQLSDMHV